MVQGVEESSSRVWKKGSVSVYLCPAEKLCRRIRLEAEFASTDSSITGHHHQSVSATRGIFLCLSAQIHTESVILDYGLILHRYLRSFLNYFFIKYPRNVGS